MVKMSDVSDSEDEEEMELFSSKRTNEKRKDEEQVEEGELGKRGADEEDEEEEEESEVEIEFAALPEMNLLDTFSSEVLTKSRIKRLPPWAFLVAKSAKDSSSWMWPVRGLDGSINKQLLKEARKDLTKGWIKGERAPIGPNKEACNRLRALCKKAWPGVPLPKIHRSFLEAEVQCGNRFWRSSSDDLLSETRKLLEAAGSALCEKENKDSANGDLFKGDDDDDSEEDEEMILKQEEQIESEAESDSEDAKRLELEKQQREIERSKNAQNIFAQLRAKRSLSKNCAGLSPRSRLIGKQDKTLTCKSSKAEIAKTKEDLALAAPKAINQRTNVRETLLEEARRRFADKRAQFNGFKSVDHLIKLEERKKERNLETKLEKLELIQDSSDSEQKEIGNDFEKVATSEIETTKDKKLVRTYSKKERAANTNEIDQHKLKLEPMKLRIIGQDDSSCEESSDNENLGSEDEEEEEMVDEQTRDSEDEDMEEGNDDNGDSRQDVNNEEKNTKKKRRAEIYKKILERENKQVLKRRSKKGDLVEDEASEEEEEEAGLEDYGGTDNNWRKKRSESEEIERRADLSLNKLSDEDLEGIVDEISDDEGLDGGDVEELHREAMKRADDEDFERLERGVKEHRLLQEVAFRRKNLNSRVLDALGDASDSEDTDEEEELANEERYRSIDDSRREQAATNVSGHGETLDEIDAEAEQQALFLRMSKMERRRRRLTKKSSSQGSSEIDEAPTKTHLPESEKVTQRKRQLLRCIRQASGTVFQGEPSNGNSFAELRRSVSLTSRTSNFSTGLDRSDSVRTAPPALSRSGSLSSVNSSSVLGKRILGGVKRKSFLCDDLIRKNSTGMVKPSSASAELSTLSRQYVFGVVDDSGAANNKNSQANNNSSALKGLAPPRPTFKAKSSQGTLNPSSKSDGKKRGSGLLRTALARG